MGGFGGTPPRKFKIYKLMCNRLRTLRIGRYAPEVLSIIQILILARSTLSSGRPYLIWWLKLPQVVSQGVSIGLIKYLFGGLNLSVSRCHSIPYP